MPTLLMAQVTFKWNLMAHLAAPAYSEYLMWIIGTQYKLRKQLDMMLGSFYLTFSRLDYKLVYLY
jgi:hypothetical protein